MDSGEVIEELVSVIADENDQLGVPGALVPCDIIGEGWFVTNGGKPVTEGVNNAFELVSPDGSVHHIFAVRVR
jgi:hypothetical protein